MEKVRNILKKRVVILDGATGTELQKRGMPAGVCPEEWCLKNPEVIQSIHREYQQAGADIVYSCTFGANRIKLSQYKINDVKKVNRDLVRLARSAVGKRALIAGDIGPTGKFVAPFGELGFEEAIKIFKEQARGLLAGGVDLFVIETMMDMQEARAALIAVKEISDKFTIVSMTYEKNGRTLSGTDCLSALITLQSLGADAVGCNCSVGPESMLDFIVKMKPYAKVPLVAKPNAGVPELIEGEMKFNMTDKEFAGFGRGFVFKGANMIGGCCGTRPDFIRKLKTKISKQKPFLPCRNSISALSSVRKTIFIGKDEPLTVIGEAINPTGKKILQKELREGKMSLVQDLAKKQEDAGADILDVNAGLPGINEVKIIKRIIGRLAVKNRLPLSIDSVNPEVIEEALRFYPGRALINSLSGEKRKLKKILPIAAKYGAMIIILPLDSKGIPQKYEQRKKIIEYVFKEAKKLGFTKDDIIVDGIAMTVSSNPGAALESLKTISWCSRVFKTGTVVGLSNISFGMPNRSWINAAYLAMLQVQGLTMAIANPLRQELMNIKRSGDLLLGKDKNASVFLAHFGKVSTAEKEKPESIPLDQRIFKAIMEGNKEDIKDLVKQAISAGLIADELVNKSMIPAINEVGDLFDKKEYFLPQLIASAEAMNTAFDEVKPYLKKEKNGKAKKTVVLLATVKGDIHDIGKNIVGLMLKNHGFSVIDLGKDVSAKRIVSKIKGCESCIVGLSALMTTTMINMKEVIELAKNEGVDCKFMLGGAVVTKAYAQSLDAEYARDGVEAVRVIKKLSE